MPRARLHTGERREFTIIKSTDPIEGNFDGLPEGASLTIGNTPFTISYHGGDGDDVVLTQGARSRPRRRSRASARPAGQRPAALW